ncbi:MAG: acyl--CoA ligase [Azoarcus sp.]|nr:acyl--CoA ligase [Azoarcus sp.]
MNRTLTHTLAEMAALFPADGASPAIEDAAGRRLDHDAIAAAAAELDARGLAWGDRFVILGEPAPATLAFMLAAWRIGAAVCPLPKETRPEALRAIAADCAASLAVETGEREHIWHAFPRGESRFRFRAPPRVTGCDLALLIYSSGSTGTPKGIMLTHANVLSALRSISAYLALRPDDIIYSALPLHFDYGLYQFLLAVFNGCRVVMANTGTNVQQALKAIGALAPTILPVVPALGSGIGRLAQAFGQQIRSVRLVTNTGGHLPGNVIQGLRRAFPDADIMPMYGLTESKRALYLSPEQLDARPGSVGRPMPGLEAKVFVAETENGREVYREAHAHETGTLWVRGSSVMQGYTSAQNGAGAEIVPGRYRDDNWLITGDLFSVDEDGFFYFRGRVKDVIKQSGYCLYPRDIEAIADGHPAVQESAVVGIHDAQGDEIACLFARAAEPLEPDALMTWMRDRLDAHYMPRKCVLVETWPLNNNGKIDRLALRQQAHERSVA